MYFAFLFMLSTWKQIVFSHSCLNFTNFENVIVFLFNLEPWPSASLSMFLSSTHLYILCAISYYFDSSYSVRHFRHILWRAWPRRSLKLCLNWNLSGRCIRWLPRTLLMVQPAWLELVQGRHVDFGSDVCISAGCRALHFEKCAGHKSHVPVYLNLENDFYQNWTFLFPPRMDFYCMILVLRTPTSPS